MTRWRRWVWLAAMTSVTATGAGGQSAGPSWGTLTGTVWDSLSAKPLAQAEILVDGGAASGSSDARGAFQVRVSPGRHLLSFRHPSLSEWPLLVHPVEVDVPAGGARRVELATASAASVQAAACGGEGGVVGGRVLDLLTLVPLTGAAVNVRSTGAGDESVSSTARADPNGGYAVCVGVAHPRDAAARLGPQKSRTVALAGEGPVWIRDLFIQVAEPATVQGEVRDGSTGRPIADASVEILGTRLRAGTRPDGRFSFRGVPPGRVQVAVERIGYGRQTVEVSAEGGAEVGISLQIFPEAVALDSMVVRVRGGTVERMRTGTRFDGLTRPAIERLLPRSVAFDDLIRNANIPGLKIRNVIYQARNGVRYPGLCVETGRTSTFHSDVCQMVEVYVNDVRIPDAETFLTGLDPASIDHFQLLSRTEAGVQYGGTVNARNGVLLIYTRGRE